MGNMHIQKMILWMLRFADTFFLSALKQSYFVELITKGSRSVMQNLSTK